MPYSEDVFLFQMADHLETKLEFDEKQSSFEGKKTIPYNTGSGIINFDIEVFSDVVEQRLVSAFVHVEGNLWFYIATGGFGSSLYVVDTKKLVDTEPVYGKNTADTLAKLKPGIVSIYKFEVKTGWIKVDAENLYKELPVT